MFEAFTKAVAYYTIGMILSLCSAWVDQVYWTWFVMPMFHVAALTIKQILVIGLCNSLLSTSVILAICTRKMGIPGTFAMGFFTVGLQLLSACMWHIFI